MATEIVVEVRALAAVLVALAAVLTAARWFTPAFVVLVFSLAAVAVAQLPRLLFLGADARVFGVLSVEEVGFVVRDVVHEALPMQLLLPVELCRFASRELGVCLLPLRRVVRLRLAGLDLALRLQEPKDWDRVRELQAAFSALDSALAALSNTDGPGAAARAAALEAPPGQVARLIDALLGRCSVRCDGLALRLAPPDAAGLRIGCQLLELPPAPLHVQRLERACGSEGWGPRLSRAIIVEGFVILAEGVREGLLDSSLEVNIISIPKASVLHLTLPPIMCGLLSTNVEPRRRVDVHLCVEPGELRLHLDRRAQRVLFGLLGRYQSAGAWTERLRTTGERRLGSLPADERRDAVDLLRRCSARSKPKPTPEDLEALARLKTRLRRAEYAALSWWATHGETALPFDAGATEEVWLQGAEALRKRAEEAAVRRMQDRPIFNELHIAITADSGIIKLHADEVLCTFTGFQLTLGLFPSMVDFAVRSHSYVAIDVQVERGQKPRTLISFGSDEERHALEFSCSRPTGGPMKVGLHGAWGAITAAVPPLLETLLPAFTCLMESDPIPAAPFVEGSPEPATLVLETQDATVTSTALRAQGLLGGLNIDLDVSFTDTTFMLPADDSLMHGVALSAPQMLVKMSSLEGKEKISVTVRGAAASVPDMDHLLEPMDEVILAYEAGKDDSEDGFISSLELRTSFARLCICPAVLLVGGEAINRLTPKSATSQQESAVAAEKCRQEWAIQNAPEERARRHAAKERIRRLFQDIDKDGSGKLDREELLNLISKLCQGILSHQELLLAFEDLWGHMDTSSDGAVNFDEFCRALEWLGFSGGRAAHGAWARIVVGEKTRGGQPIQHRSSGFLIVRAGELNCSTIVNGIENREERLWALLANESGFRLDRVKFSPRGEKIDVVRSTSGEGQAPEELQMKLLRVFRNYEAAKSWWASTVSPTLSLAENWMISEDHEIRGATDLMLEALAGHLTTHVDAVEMTPSAAVPVDTRRCGWRFVVVLSGCEIGMRDPVSQLRGRARVILGAGFSGAPDSVEPPLVTGADDKAALLADVLYWHQGGCVHLGRADKLLGRFTVNGLRTSCLNPFCEEPDQIVERWGFRSRIESIKDDKKVEFELVSDQHFVVNLTSSALLALKPMIDVLTPQEKASRKLPLGWGSCAAPLDQLVRMFGSLNRKVEAADLALHCLYVSSNSVGRPVLGETEIKVSIASPTEIRRSAQAERVPPRHMSAFTCKLKWHQVLTRITVEGDWELDSLQFVEATLTVKLRRRSAVGEPKIHVFVRNRMLDSDELRDMGCRSGVISHEAKTGTLRLLNRCGWTATAWFTSEATKSIVIKSGNSTNLKVPTSGDLCLKLYNGKTHGDVLYPDLTNFGRFALAKVIGEEFVHIKLSVIGSDQALLEIHPPVRLRNATRHLLRVELTPPIDQSPGDSFVEELLPGETMPVPLAAMEGWTVTTRGAVAHAFALDAVLQPQERVTRRALGLALMIRTLPVSGARKEVQETSQHRRDFFLKGGNLWKNSGENLLAIAAFNLPKLGISGQDQGPRLRTLLLLPGLRVTNGLPLDLRATLECETARGKFGDQSSALDAPMEHQLTIGAAVDFNLVGARTVVTIRAGNEGDCIEIPADASWGNSFQELSRQIQLGGITCFVKCRWSARAGAEMVLCGDYVVFNKTSMRLRISGDRKVAPVLVEVNGRGSMAVLRSPKQEFVVSLENDEQVGEKKGKHLADSQMPYHSGQLWLRCGSHVSGYMWESHLCILKDGELELHKDETESTRWRLSRHSSVSDLAMPQALGTNAFRLEDPCRGQNLVLQADTQEEFEVWLLELRRTVDAWRALSARRSFGASWDSKAFGHCRKAPLPSAVKQTFSLPIPVQVPGEGEVVISGASSCETGCYAFLGVQVHPLLGALLHSTGITLTPRFVVQNRTSTFIEALPALVPGNKDIPIPVHAALAQAVATAKLLRQREAAPTTPNTWTPTPHTWNFLKEEKRNFGKEASDSHAIWIPPGESVAFFHFPVFGASPDTQLKELNKVVSLRLAGQSSLEVVSLNQNEPLRLERVGVCFPPYLDDHCHFGPLPQALRVFSRDGRLQCLRGWRRKKNNWGHFVLSTRAHVFVGVPEQTSVPETWLREPWEALPDRLNLRNCGINVGSLRLFGQLAPVGPLFLEEAGEGSVILFAHAFCDLSEDTGLPWCDWVHLDVTGEELRSLPTEDGQGEGCETRFVHCSMQVESSTAFLVLSDGSAPYRVENRSPTRTLALRFGGNRHMVRVLPPLSWRAFAWPRLHREDTLRKEKKRLVVQDVHTNRTEMYDVDEVGPGTPLNPEAAVRRVGGRDAPLTEEGYRDVLILMDTYEMAHFVKRVCEELNGKFPRGDAQCQEVARRYSGEVASRSIRGLRAELIRTGIAPMPKAVLTQEGCMAASICDEVMVHFFQELLASAGLGASEADLYGYAVQFGRFPTLPRFLQELPTKEWVRPTSPVEKAYASLIATPSQGGSDHAASMQLCLRRGLAEAGVLVEHARVLKAAEEAAREQKAGRPLQWPEALARACRHSRFLRTASFARTSSFASVPNVASFEGSAPHRLDMEDYRFDEKDLAEAVEEQEPEDFEIDEEAAQAEMENVARSEPLTEAGYSRVATLDCKAAFAVFVARVIAQDEGQVLDSDSLNHFCAYQMAMMQGGVKVDLSQLRKELTAQSWLRFRGADGSRLFVERYFDGPTKVISFSEAQHKVRPKQKQLTEMDASEELISLHCWDIDVQLAGLHICVVHEPRAHALGTNKEMTKTSSEEVLGLTWDHLRLTTLFGSCIVEFRIHHFQMDNFRGADREYPIIVAPKDSGFHGDRRDRHSKHDSVSFFYFAVEKEVSDILHVRQLKMVLEPVLVRLDVGFLLDFARLMSDWLPEAKLGCNDTKVARAYLEALRDQGIAVPIVSSSQRLVYLELLWIEALFADVEIFVPPKGQLARSTSRTTLIECDDEDDIVDFFTSGPVLWLSNLVTRKRGPVQKMSTNMMIWLSGLLQSVGQGVLSGVGHITPSFTFPRTILENEFSERDRLVSRLTRGYIKSGLMQWWKVLFSTNILGDPIGWGVSVSGGFVQLFTKTSSEIIRGDLRGEGLKCFAQGVLGGTAAHAGKFLGAVGDSLDALVAYNGSASSTKQPSTSVTHVGEGAMRGVKSTMLGFKAGAKGLFAAPIAGYREAGSAGLGLGVVKGISGVVVKPVTGILHGVQKVAEGVDATTHLWDKTRPIALRRLPRSLEKEVRIPEFMGVEFVPRIAIKVEALTWPTASTPPLSRSMWTISISEDEGQQHPWDLVTLTKNKWSYSTKLGRVVANGLRFTHEEAHVPTNLLLTKVLVVNVFDRATGARVFTTRLPRSGHSSPLDIVAHTLRRRQRRLTRRQCGDETVCLPLDPIEGETGPSLELNFFPAYDAATVPASFRFEFKRPDCRSRSVSSVVTPSIQGVLEKRRNGPLHLWSSKYVTVADGYFKYWEKYEQFDRGLPPKVALPLASRELPWRFTFGEDATVYFAQVYADDGRLDSKWRPTRGKSPTEWLQVILQNSFEMPKLVRRKALFWSLQQET